MPKSRAVSETEQEEETNNESSSAAKSHIQFLDLTNGKGGDQSMGEDDDEDDDDNDVDVNDDLVGQAVYGDESMVFGTNNNNLHHLNHNDLHSNPNSSYEEGGEEGNNNNNNHNEEDEYDDVGILHTLADLSSVPSSSQKNEVVYSSESAMMTMLMGTAAAAAAASSGSNNSIGGGSLGSLEDPASDSIEHTGRWTKEEHEAFLAGLQKFGKEWKKVAAKVKTRTVVQTRTHAQKYFQKLQKTIDVKGDGGDWSVDIGTDSNLTSSSVAVAAAVEPKKVSASNTVGRVRRTKGHVVVAPASTDALNNSSSSHKAFRRGSAATLSAAQVISTLSAAKTTNATDFGVHPNSNITPSRNAIATTASPHGFSFSDDGGGKSQMVAASENENSSGFVGWRLGKIVAPDPSDPRSKFPEPSPAATGKRKLAEMAAARMLAGVGSPDGPPTPPAPDPPSASLRLSNAPPPPLFSRNKGATLQIVNPESLGVTYQTKGKRGDSPMTPWDGELEALVVSAALDEDEDKGVSLSIETDLVSANYDTGDNKLLCTASTPSNVHPIHGPPDAFERSPLHQAVCSQDVEALRTLLQVVEPEDLQRIDEAGFSPLHSACAVLLHPERDNNVDENGCNEMVRLLLSAGAKPTQLDSKGNCPLHWAARAGDSDATDQLLSCNGNLFENVQNSSGETPLHWGLRAGNKGADIVALLLTHGARPGILDKNFRRAIDVAAEGFLDDDMSIAAVALRGAGKSKKPPGEMKKLLTQSNQERRDCRANILIRSTPSRTLVLHHPECLEHHTKSQADWEAPDRVRTIMKRILPSSDPTGATETSGIFPYEVTVSQEFDRASLDLLSRVHSTEYLSFVNTLSKDLERKVHETGGASSQDSDPLSWSPPPVVPFTPMVQRTMIRIHESNVKLSDNSDTSFSVGSLRAARRAAGAVQHAVHS